MAGYIILALIITLLGILTWVFYRRSERLRIQLLETAPYLRAAGAPEHMMDKALGIDDWDGLDQSKSNKPGNFQNQGFCPCESGYTCKTDQAVINAWPNPAQVAACTAAPPAVAAPLWECNENCINVLTHVWHGWSVWQNVNTGQIKFNCNTYGLYHCKKPTDPDAEKPPKQGHPDDPEGIEP